MTPTFKSADVARVFTISHEAPEQYGGAPGVLLLSRSHPRRAIIA